MYDSGLIDIESHSLFHGEVFSGADLVDFVGPDTPLAAYETPVTPYLDRSHAGKPLERNKLLGLPLFPATPLLRGETAFRPTEELTEFCRSRYTELSAQNGESDWKSQLRAAVAARFPDGGLTRASRDETVENMLADLKLATAMIREQLDDRAGAHLCFPYSQGSELAVELAKKLGLRSCFWGVVPGQRANTSDTVPGIWYASRPTSCGACRARLGTAWPVPTGAKSYAASAASASTRRPLCQSAAVWLYSAIRA